MMASEETSRVEYWLQSCKFAAPTAPIILIGTHADHSRCTPEYIEALIAQLQRYKLSKRGTYRLTAKKGTLRDSEM